MQIYILFLLQKPFYIAFSIIWYHINNMIVNENKCKKKS